MSDGRAITSDFVVQATRQQAEKFRGQGNFDLAARIFEQMMTSPDMADFLTLVAYDYID